MPKCSRILEKQENVSKAFEQNIDGITPDFYLGLLCMPVLFFNCTALDIHGYERPLIVGLDPVIKCSTRLNVTQLEWFLEGFDTALETSTTQDVSLPLDLTSDGLDGAMFRCRATTHTNGVYEKTITFAVKGMTSIVPQICVCLAVVNMQTSLHPK